ncbi:hypothetical protein ACOTDF_13215 [Achromobacter insuavis]|uniref:hypothetical protein n=1 Tax=Achromobacter insuavis TaxID=1287735 RepID=UPI003B9A9D9A
MSSFTIRIELHNANTEKHAELDKIMESNGFQRNIVSDLGTTYSLPTGEYNFIGNEDRSTLLKKIKAAAAPLKINYSVLITESKGRTWFNLSQ